VIIGGYVGEKERTRDALASAGCALITLRDEALGVMSPSKLHAALAMGIPILYIGPAGSNVDEAIRTFGCGLSVRQGDAAAVVSFINSLRQDPTAHRAMRVKAREAFISRFSDKNGFDAFDALLGACAIPRPAADKSGASSQYVSSTAGPVRAL
jgi:glycosyltransferase involved in cell wall biosynthesis